MTETPNTTVDPVQEQADAIVTQGEDVRARIARLVTQAAERLYTARFQLGLFDPQGSSPLDKIPYSDTASEKNRP